MADALLPFGIRGPGPLIETALTERKTSDGQIVTTTWAYPWFISSVQHNARIPQVRAWLRWVFQHSRSWVWAGVWFPEVGRSKDARVVIRYVPDPFQCGDVPEALGCCDRQMGPNGQTLIRMGRSRLTTPDTPKVFSRASCTRWPMRPSGRRTELVSITLSGRRGSWRRARRRGSGRLRWTCRAFWPSRVARTA